MSGFKIIPAPGPQLGSSRRSLGEQKSETLIILKFTMPFS